jgi:hypothetical protein
MSDMDRWTAGIAAFGKGAAELLFYLPVVIITAVYAFPDGGMVWWLAALLLCYAAPALVVRGGSISLWKRLLGTAAAGALAAAASLLLAGEPIAPLPFLACTVIGAYVGWKGAAQLLHGWTNSFNGGYMLAGVLAYLAIMPFKRTVPGLDDYGVVLTAGGMASIVAFMLIVNERHVGTETAESGQSASASQSRRYNRILISMLAAVIFVIALFRQVQERLEETIGSLFRELMAWLTREREEEPDVRETPVQEPMPDMFPPAEPREPSKLMQLIELILQLAIYAALAVFAVWFVFWGAKRLAVLVRWLWARLQDRKSADRSDSEAFTDEVEQLLTFATWRDQVKNRFRRQGEEGGKGWNDLRTNAERAKYLYVQLIKANVKRGYEPKACKTPRETAAELPLLTASAPEEQAEWGRFIRAYEAARYGNKSLDGEEMDKYKALLEKRSQTK